VDSHYFKNMLGLLAERAATSTVSWLGFANVPLRRHLREVFARHYGDSGSYVGDPAFEAVFGWTAADTPMAELEGALLAPQLVDSMANPRANDLPEYRFPRERYPYAHQLEAWKTLAQPDPRSVVVASGTGSGKTECFLVPILDRLIRERQSIGGRLIGVRALFLYPLNALINSQRDRLRAWTSAFDEDIRFCLYNGLTPEAVRSNEAAQHPSEVLDRRTLRAVPPPILVTNATMLEYMLVRTPDQPILQQSQGKLEWVVLDEAHTYIGSQAAEMALLIRRVLHAFGVDPERVRFVATSATLGRSSTEGIDQLREFLAQLAGVSTSTVHVITGLRAIPILPAVAPGSAPPSREELWRLDGGLDGTTPSRYSALAAHPVARSIRDLFVRDRGPQVAKLSDICRHLVGGNASYTLAQQEEALDWLDILASTTASDRTPFLPLRAHVFHQTLSGLWACADSACPERERSALSDGGWRFGRVYFAPRQHCGCGAPVYELVACEDCGTVYLRADVHKGLVLQQHDAAAVDEFELELDDNDGDEDSPEDEDTQGGPDSRHGMLIVNHPLNGTEELCIQRSDRRIVERPTQGALQVIACEDAGEGLQCPACTGVSRRERYFRKARIGAPFLLGVILPTLLEFAPDADEPQDLPYRGRRLLTFSDSRQGTARLAAKLQQDSERMVLRGLIYHHALPKRRIGQEAKVQSLTEEIDALEGILAGLDSPEKKTPIIRLIHEKKHERDSLSNPRPTTFGEMQHALAQEGRDFRHVWRAYEGYSREAFGGHDGAHKLAGMLLVREFGRRPRRQNSLETLGLVAICYPLLDQVTSPPPEWQSRSFSIDDWRAFLKVALDQTVRGGGSLDVRDEWRNWLGLRFSRTSLVAPDKQDLARDQRRWPQARRSGAHSPLVRLLSYLFKIDTQSAYSKDVIDQLLLAAWDDLRRVGLLSLGGTSGYVLKLEHLAFQCLPEAWVCPVTRRFLDTAVCGVTQYLPRQATDESATCVKTTLPVYDLAFGGDTDPLSRVRRARKWLAEQAQLPKLREEGLWSDVSDRVIELTPYFATGEHSAQQPADLLDKYEKAFKKGQLNLLSCSTTMELGIDIGGVQIVAMNNVPPHPGNYLQRAGRAGRRQETTSAAVTLCRSNPHDQTVFSNSRWAFDTHLPAPAISLNSAVIVQRHVNAMVLSHFLSTLLAESRSDLSKLTCGWFFEASDPPPALRLIGWCSGYQSGAHPSLEQGLRRLTRHSTYEGIATSALLQGVAEEIAAIREGWLNEWTALTVQLGTTDSQDRFDPAVRAVAHQKRRLANEYLLRELATRGFLPAYGFPAFIASFDNMTLVEARRLRPATDNDQAITPRQDDNRYRRRDLASRDLVTALREYAPGSEVVMNGMVYRSAGITLNWHMPADQQDAQETQAIKFAWRCGGCGASGASLTGAFASVCDACGREIRAEHIQQFLEPAGFSVDFYEAPHNDISIQRFVPVEPPWVSARGSWSPLPNPKLGRFRATSEGHVYHHSSGANRSGYAICLSCGRAEPMPQGGILPSVFADNGRHKRLRSRAKERDCPGSINRWAIKQGIRLGHEVKTDVLEIQIQDQHGQWLTDRVTARTIAVAIRDALASLIGVQASELACDVKPSLTEEGHRCISMLVFDRFAAGYSSTAHRFIESIFRLARARLECPKDCDSACPSCVLDYDQRFFAESLDRHAALRLLTPHWLDTLKLPVDMRLLGEGSRVEVSALSEGILRESGNQDVKLVRLFTGSPRDNECAVGSSPLRELTYRLAALGRPVEIVVAEGALAALDEAERYSLASLADHPSVLVRTIASLPIVGESCLLAEVQSGNSATRWASQDLQANALNEDWGQATSAVIVASGLDPLKVEGEQLTPGTIRPTQEDAGDREIVIHHELDGDVQSFGTNFWNLVAGQHKATKALLESSQQVAGLEYSDRYLFTPLSVALLLEIVAGLRRTVGQDRWATPICRVSTTRTRPSGTNRTFSTVYADWPDSTVRDKVVLGAFNHIGLNADIQVPDKQQLRHGRILTVSFSGGGNLAIRFDQGVSYWRVPSVSAGQRVNASFNFDHSKPDGLRSQIERVAELSLPVEGAVHPTELFAKAR
jgi:DEAD/DEAH box helicase domain-containing protein